MDENYMDSTENTQDIGAVSGNDIPIYQDVSGNSQVVTVPDISGNGDMVYPSDSTEQSTELAAEPSYPDDYVRQSDFYALLLMFATLLCYLMIYNIFNNLFNMRRKRHDKKM